MGFKILEAGCISYIEVLIEGDGLARYGVEQYDILTSMNLSVLSHPFANVVLITSTMSPRRRRVSDLHDSDLEEDGRPTLSNQPVGDCSCALVSDGKQPCRTRLHRLSSCIYILVWVIKDL